MARSLGELLVEESFLDEEGLQVARREARKAGLPLVVWLTQEGRVAEADLADALERRLKLPRVDLTQVFVEGDAVREVPYDVAQSACVLPLAVERSGARRVLRLAMADPLDRRTIEEIEQGSGGSVEVYIGLPSEIAPAIQHHYRGVTTRLIPRAQRRAGNEGAEGATQPHHRLEDEAPIEARLRALVTLLVERGLISEEEWIDAIKRILGDET